MQIDVAPSQVKFRFANVELVSKLVEGKFPDFNRVIPKGYNKSFVISREELHRSLQRAAIVTSDKFKGVRFLVSENLLKISANNTENEEAQEEIEVTYDGDALDIGFNVSYLLDVLTNTNAEQVVWHFNDANSSALITIAGNDHFKYVVMPMRI